MSNTLDEASLAQHVKSSLSEPDMHLLVSPRITFICQTHMVVSNNFASCLQSFCLSQRITHLQLMVSILIAPRCKIAFALLNHCKILRSGTFSSVIPRFSSLMTVLPNFCPQQVKSIRSPPEKYNTVHNSTRTRTLLNL